MFDQYVALLGLAAPAPMSGSAAAQGRPAAGPASDEAGALSRLDDLADVQTWLTGRIAEQLRLEDVSRLSPRRDLMQLGLDSLLFLDLSSNVQRRLGVRIDAEQAYRDMTVEGLARLIVAQGGQGGDVRPAAVDQVMRHDEAGRYRPFPLTPIQHAYWMGRTALIEYGGVACHVLFEWDLDQMRLDLDRLERAWNTLVRRHDMLRMVITDDGQQRILPQVDDYRIGRRDLSALAPQDRQRELDAIRQDMSYRVLPANRWPLFELSASDLGDGQYRLHMNLDLLLFDVQSFKVMMDDLASFYQGDELTPLPITFRDYVMDGQARRRESAWLASWCYWQDRLADLPPAPALPLSGREPVAQPHFTTLQSKLARKDWARPRETWQAAGVTPSAALMTLFAWTLERWSRWPAFTLNLTFFNRRPAHPQIRQLIGDFTSVLLVDFDLDAAATTLLQSMEQTQQRLWQHLAHSRVNGVELLRDLGRLRGQSRQPLMPVVFTSMLGMTLDGLAIDQAMTSLLGDPVNVFTQTPQVWLDHQVMEIDNELVFSWYCMDEVLAEGAAQAMFEDYCAVLRAVAAEPELMSRPGLWRQSAGAAGPAPFARQRWPWDDAGDGPDLRDIENAIRGLEGVWRAEAVLAPDGDELLVKAVAAPRGFALGTDGAWLAQAAQAMQVPDPAEQDEFDAAWQALEARALRGIVGTLADRKLFVQTGERLTFEAICENLQVVPRFERVARQWLRVLCDAGWLTHEEGSHVCVRPLDEVRRELTVPDVPDSPWAKALASYLDDSIAAHVALLQGRRSALELFFAGDQDISLVMYVENPAARCMIRNAGVVASALAHGVGQGGLRVLDVGAGTGATTAQVLQALGGALAGYHFTDVSPLFLDEAARRFAHCPQMTFGIFDINLPVDYAAHRPAPGAGYDLVVAAQVMHDASHVVRSLRRLGSVMKPGGWLMLTEATRRDSALQLASVAFIEGLSGYQDFRAVDDKSMLDLAQWRAALQEAGFEVAMAWPDQDVSPIHQHLIVARLVRAAQVDGEAVADALRSRFGEVLPRLRVEQCEASALFISASREPEDTADGRAVGAGRGASACATRVPPEGTSAARPADGVRQEPEDVQGRVAQVWESFLGRSVQRDSDFFHCGGDSLIATRVFAQINRMGIANASLQSLFAHPTLAGALDGEIWGLQAPETVQAQSLQELAAGYLDSMRKQLGRGPSLLVGWSYGAAVAAEVARRLHHEGQAVPLVLIDPVCRADFAVSDLSGLMRLLAAGKVPLDLPEDAGLSEDGMLAEFLRRASDAGLFAKPPAPDEARRWLERVFRLLDLLARHDAPAPVPVPCLWLSADRHPEHWTPAEQDWGAWADGTERRTVAADHWQLVQDVAAAAQIAALVRQWWSRTQVTEGGH